MSSAELQRMARAWNDLLKQAGLRIAWQEAVWCWSAADNLEAAITVSDVGITRRSRNMISKRWECGSLMMVTTWKSWQNEK